MGFNSGFKGLGKREALEFERCSTRSHSGDNSLLKTQDRPRKYR